MNVTLIVLSAILVLIASIVTVFVLKQEEKKSKQYATEKNSEHSEFLRSQEYEKNSVKKYIPIQLWIYGLTTVFTLVLILFFMKSF